MSETSADLLIERAVRRRVFHCLDALRGIAAAVVLTRHAPSLFGVGLFPGSALGVDLFFVMSGFVIAYAYADRLADGLSFREFMRIRLIRLYPLYILGTVIGASVALLTIATGISSTQTGFDWSASRLAGAFLPALFIGPSPPIPGSHGSLYPLNAVAWSLAFEIAINVLYAFAFPLVRIATLVTVMILSAAGLIVSAVYFRDLDLGWNWTNWVGGVFRVGYGFSAGVLIFCLHEIGRLRIRSHYLVPVVLTVLALTLAVPLSLRLPLELLVILVGFPVITVLAIKAETPSWLFKPFLFLGLTSYAVYALHRPILSVVNGVAQVLHLTISAHSPWAGVVFLVAFFGLCWLIDLAYDKPVRRFLLRRTGRQKGSAGTPEAKQVRLS